MRSELPESCATFRELLERTLCEATREKRELSWHEHLVTCESCHRLLEEEEALDWLLANQPSPELPPELAKRLLARLRGQRASQGLDALLEQDLLDEPEGLADRIKRDLALDRLLEREAEAEIPVGLSARVLNGLKSERERSRTRSLPLRRLMPLAASLLALLGLFFLNRDGASPLPLAELPVDERPSSEMLALLDLLADEAIWEEELWGDDEAVSLALELDESDELLLEYLAASKDEEEENG